MAESKEELKSLLIKVQEETEKAGLKLNIQKTKIWSHHFMTNRCGNNGNSDGLYFGGLKNHCRWWLQAWNWNALAPWKKSYDKPRQHIKNQRHYLLTKVQLVKAMVFPVVMYGCERWTIKLSAEELNLLNCGVGADSWESLELQGDPTSQS